MDDESTDNDRARRAFFGALGAAVGISALGGCVDATGASAGGEAQTSAALVGATPVKWVDSVSVDLRSATATPVGIGSSVVIARGYANDNDGGGGIFGWDPTAATGDDGGTIIVPAAGGGRWMRLYSGPIDIRWFGAVASSPLYAPVNTTAIQSAIAVAARSASGVNAGRVLVPQGQWYVNGTITLSQIDSVILTSAGGAGSWGASGAYGHQSAKLVWTGGAGTMLSFSATMRCGVQGLMLDGGGAAIVGIRLDGTSNPAKGNLFDDVAIINLAATGTAVWVGSSANRDVAFNTFRRLFVSGGGVGVLQEGSQSVSNIHEDGVVLGYGQYGMKFSSGDITVSRCLFTGDAAASADVFVARTAAYARFVGNYHEIVGQTGYAFEATTAGALRPHATVFLGVRALYLRTTGSPQRIIEWKQDGHLTLVSCEFDGLSGANSPEVYLEAPDVGWTDLGLMQEIGCRYLNGVRCVVDAVNGAYSSLYSNGNPVLPAPGSVVGEHLTIDTRLKVHNGEVVIQDNAYKVDAVRGTRLSSYFGQLVVDTLDARTGAALVLVRNAGAQRFVVNEGGGPGFYGATAAPIARPTVTGSRAGNAALTDLLAKLAGFGLITDGTTA